jgi:hypothetical protein
MLSIDQLVTNVLADIRGRSGVRFIKGDVVRALNRAILTVSTSLLETKEDLLVDIDNGGLPTVLNMPVASADGSSRIQRPGTWARIRKVEVFTGNSWMPIRELKTGEWQAGELQIPVIAGPAGGMRYELRGRYIVFNPGTLTSYPGGVRVSKEVEIPALFMGICQSPGAASFALPGAASDTEGTLLPYDEDDIYNNFSVRIYEGTGSGQTRKVLDYVAATRVITPETNFAPALGADSKFAFITPFYDVVSGIDQLIQTRAAITMLATQRGEDLSGYITEYNDLEEAMLTKLGRLAPGPGQILPVDADQEYLYW